MKDDVADALASCGPTRLPGQHHVTAARAQRVAESRRLERFAEAFPALERQEEARAHL